MPWSVVPRCLRLRRRFDSNAIAAEARLRAQHHQFHLERRTVRSSGVMHDSAPASERLDAKPARKAGASHRATSDVGGAATAGTRRRVMILGIGTDIVSIARIRDALDRHGAQFAQRILSDAELLVLNDIRTRCPGWPNVGRQRGARQGCGDWGQCAVDAGRDWRRPR